MRPMPPVKRNMYLIGRPTSGQTSHAKFLVKFINESGGNAALISPGDLCRDAARDTTHKYHQTVKAASSNGVLVSDDKIFEMVLDERARLRENHGATTFVFCGFPRTVEQVNQAKLLENGYGNDGHRVQSDFVHLEIDDAEVRSRAAKRRKIDLKLYGESRKDDNPDIVEQRLLEFHDNTDPALQLLDLEDRLISIRTQEQEIEAVDEMLAEMFGERLMGELERISHREGTITQDYGFGRRF